MNTDLIFSELEKSFSNAKINKIDGVKFDLAEGWVHFRKSNTEPIMRIYSEAKDEEKAHELATLFKTEINRIIQLS